MEFVAFLSRGRLLWGFYEPPPRERIWVDGRGRLAPERGIVLGRLPVQETLRTDQEKRKALRSLLEAMDAQEIPDLHELWDVVAGETHLPPEDLFALLDLPEDSLVWLAFLRKLSRDPRFMWNEDGTVSVLSRQGWEDLREQERARAERKQLEQALRRWLAGHSALPEHALLAPYRDAFRQYALTGRVPPLLESLPLPDPDRMLERLTREGWLPRDVNEVPYRLALPRSFAVETLPAPPWLEVHEVWEGGVAVDDPETFEVDDAWAFLKVEEDRLVVRLMVAAPAVWFRPGNPLLEEALKRMLTVYTPDEIFPMFPRPLVEQMFSLSTEEARPALVVDVTLDRQGEVLEARWHVLRVRLLERWSPEQWTRWLETQPEGREVQRFIEARRRWREKRGSVSTLQPYIKVRLYQGWISVDRVDPDAGQEATMEWMLLYNALFAEALLRHGVPGYYRASEQVEHRAPGQFPRAFWTARPLPHPAVGLPLYTQGSSPIRRAIDLVLQIQFLHALKGMAAPYTEEDLVGIGVEYEERSRQARLWMRRRTRYWVLRWLEEEEPRLRAEVRAPGRVWLPDILEEAELAGANQVRPGDVLWVRPDRVWPRRGRIRVRCDEG